MYHVSVFLLFDAVCQSLEAVSDFVNLSMLTDMDVINYKHLLHLLVAEDTDREVIGDVAEAIRMLVVGMQKK